jgi:hypothetical protein
MKHSRVPLAILVLSIALLPACSGTGVAPTSAEPADGGSVSIEAAASAVRAVSGTCTTQIGIFEPLSSCRDPYVAPVGLIVRSTRHVNVFVREIRTRVVSDSMQIRLPPVTFPAPLLIQEFGTNRVEAQSQRLFPFRVMVGCGFKSNAVVVDVDTDDDQGRQQTGRVTVTLR